MRRSDVPGAVHNEYHHLADGEAEVNRVASAQGGPDASPPPTAGQLADALTGFAPVAPVPDSPLTKDQKLA